MIHRVTAHTTVGVRPLPAALVLVGLLLVAGNLRAAITTVGPVLPHIQASLGISSVAASVLVSLPLLAFAVVSPFAPRLANALGLERAIALSLAVLAAGLVLRSTPPIALLWVGTALIGLSIAVLNVVLPALVKRDFPTKIGQVTGAYSAVQSIFAAIAAGVAVPVAGMSDLGWRIPLGMWAGLAIVTIGVLLPQLSHPSSKPVRSRPVGDAGGERTPSTGTTGQTEGIRAVDNIKGSADTGEVYGFNPWRRVLAWQLTAFMGIQSVAFYVFITWLPAIEVDAGISEAAAGGHQFLLNASAIIGNLVCSTLIARLPDQRLLGVFGPTLLLTATLGILFAPQWAAVWACVAGLGGGSSIVLALSFFGLRTRNHTQAGKLSGMAQAVGYLFAAAGPIAVGALHDATGSWVPALTALAGVLGVLVVVGYHSGRDRYVD
jgi:CP family cyanate transporter-like MFS transporter